MDSRSSSVKKALFLVALMISGLVIVHFGLKKIPVTPVTTPGLSTITPSTITPSMGTTPALFTLFALFSGWNSTLPAGSTTPCSPSGTPTCNPAMTQFRDVLFTATLKGVTGDFGHIFALYRAGTDPNTVAETDCTPPVSNGCIKASGCVGTGTGCLATRTLSYNATIPVEGSFNGTATLDYFCTIHPTLMHGTITLYKSPDVDHNHQVNVVDLATVAIAFGSTPTSSNWNAAADINNDGKVNVLDLAFVAIYYGSSL
jgi:Dockerin type I domain